jgi:hypothetical protein
VPAVMVANNIDDMITLSITVYPTLVDNL